MKKSLILLLGLLLAFSMLLIAYLSFTPAELREVEHSQDSFHHNDEKKEKPLSGKITVLTNRVDLVADGTMQRYAVKFQEKHPHVQVEFEGLKNYMHDIRIRLTTGEAGDVLLIPEYVPNSEFKDYFEPLPDEMFEYVRFTDIMLHEGKRYGMATGVNTLGIVYNKKAFAKAGITSIPLTLDELFEAAHKLKGVGVIPLYSNYGAQWPLGVWGEHSVSWRSGDAEYLGKMVHEEEPFQLDNAWGQGISILRYFIEHELVEPDLLSNNWEKSKRQIANGEAAMYCLGSWVINQIIDAGAAPEEIGIFPLPYDNSGRLYAPMDPDWMIGVNKQSKNKEAAFAWIDFFVKESGYVEENGFIPVLTTNEPTLPQMTEFLSYQPSLIESADRDATFYRIGNAAQIPFGTGALVQELAVAPDLQQEFEKLNKRWQKAKKSLGY